MSQLPSVLSCTALGSATLTIILIRRVVIEIRLLVIGRLAIFPEVRKICLGFDEDLDKIVEHGFVPIVDEGSGQTLIANASSSTWYRLAWKHCNRLRLTDAVNVLVHAIVFDIWAVIVDDVHDIADVEATSGDSGGDKDGGFASAESAAVEGQLLRCK